MDDCRKCGLHRTRRHVVIGRGDVPARVLFIGEGPGVAEDVRGIPFTGPSGALLNAAIGHAARLVSLNAAPSHYMTNVVRCRPVDDIGNNREPTAEEAWACWPYLEQTFLDVAPVEIVFLGKKADEFCRKAFPYGVKLDHPAYVLRVGGSESPEYIRFVRNLSEVFRRAS